MENTLFRTLPTNGHSRIRLSLSEKIAENPSRQERFLRLLPLWEKTADEVGRLMGKTIPMDKRIEVELHLKSDYSALMEKNFGMYVPQDDLILVNLSKNGKRAKKLMHNPSLIAAIPNPAERYSYSLELSLTSCFAHEFSHKVYDCWINPQASANVEQITWKATHSKSRLGRLRWEANFLLMKIFSEGFATWVQMQMEPWISRSVGGASLACNLPVAKEGHETAGPSETDIDARLHKPIRYGPWGRLRLILKILHDGSSGKTRKVYNLGLDFILRVLDDLHLSDAGPVLGSPPKSLVEIIWPERYVRRIRDDMERGSAAP
ncbi:Uncharacterised protein [uncultured archaeon]|nr:Uncharacterised protein [uncultured archaeon]